MRVKMTALECGPAGTFNIGDERDVSESHGKALVAGRHALDITVYEKAVVVPEESAVVEVQEQAVLSAHESRGKHGKRK